MQITKATAPCLIILGLMGNASSLHAKGPYFDYETFHSLTGLVPEVQNPRPAGGGTTEAGYQLWMKGEMRLPEPDQYRAQADFDGDGKPDVALPFKSEKGFHLLIAEQSGDSWQRKALFELPQESGVSWNGKVLHLEPHPIFLHWDGQRYRLDQGPLAMYVYGYSEPELHGVLLKTTYIGPQNEPLKGLLLMTHYGSPDLGAFRPHRRNDVSYANDDNLWISYLTLSSARMRDILQTLLESPWVGEASKRMPAQGAHYSVSVIDMSSPHRPNFFEVLVTHAEIESFLHQAAEKIEPQDPSAAKILRAYQ